MRTVIFVALGVWLRLGPCIFVFVRSRYGKGRVIATFVMYLYCRCTRIMNEPTWHFCRKMQHPCKVVSSIARPPLAEPSIAIGFWHCLIDRSRHTQTHLKHSRFNSSSLIVVWLQEPRGCEHSQIKRKGWVGPRFASPVLAHELLHHILAAHLVSATAVDVNATLLSMPSARVQSVASRDLYLQGRNTASTHSQWLSFADSCSSRHSRRASLIRPCQHTPLNGLTGGWQLFSQTVIADRKWHPGRPRSSHRSCVPC
ncbi:hypothetical protein HII31_05745 [Pseudocercospora fuligena]|uniref:Uncharacterized protein n=1 Tax=Pseudocercospora fuligena TaxID=685502 RepID=A0A8H6RKY7_9PEZI|nr:hypothetical protein HII31_05745 [Pseudocercospora fuligena]